MLEDKNLVRVQVVSDEEIQLNEEIFARANKLSPIPQVEVGSEQNVEVNFEQFDYTVNIPKKQEKEVLADVEYNYAPSPIKNNKVSPKQEENNDELAKSETKFEQNNPITVQPLKRKIQVNEVPEKKYLV